MEGYYDPYPQVALERPVALIGFFGAQVEQVAYQLSARTGVPFLSLDRWMEHRVGQHLGRTYLERGECSTRDLEREALAHALAHRPMGIIALGDGALIDPESVEKVLAGATLVYLQCPLGELYRRIEKQMADRPTRFFPFVTPENTRGPADLEWFFSQRLAGYRAAPLSVEIAHKHPLTVAGEVAQLLQLE